MNIETGTLREAKCLYLLNETEKLRFIPRTLCYQVVFEKDVEKNRLQTNFYQQNEVRHRVITSLIEEIELCKKIYEKG